MSADDPEDGQTATDDEPADATDSQEPVENAGQPDPAAGGDDSLVDQATAPTTKDYTKRFAIAAVAIGLGLGVLVFLVSQFGGSPTMPAQGNMSNNATQVWQKAHTQSMATTGITMAQLLPLFLAPLAGALVASQTDLEFKETAVTAGVATGVASLVLAVVGGFAASTQFPTYANNQSLGTGLLQASLGAIELSFEVGTAAINGVMVGVVAALVAAAAVYAVDEV